ncbi:MAG TPA: S9 family peptidase, partial [Xanthomonadaceae bacterium]|nr:S9 family peptidase [Xanthomonadaceae bacterium]
MAATNVDVAAYLKRDEFKELKLSPDGAYYAASVPLADHSLLAVVRRADNKVTATFNLGKDDYVATFAWVSPGRLLIESARKFGELDQPALTGNIYAMNADGSDKAILVGQDVNVNSVDSHIQQKKTETIAAFLLDPLPDDDRTVLISVEPFTGDSFSRVERMDVFSGRRILVMRAPVQNANFVTDGNGDVRFAYGYDAANHHKLYYRSGAGAADWTHAAGWTLLNDENASSHVEVPLGFSADGRYAYLEVEQPQGPDAVVALDTRDGSRKTLVQDDDSDPVGVIRSLGTPYPAPVGVFINDGKPRTAFFDDNAPEARLYRSLEAAFAGQSVVITSKTADGHLALVEVSSDRNPGDFYLFDTVNKKADFLTARRSWLDPEAMAEVRPFQMEARDGQVLHGFLTVPHGSDGKRLPLVVLPHGGPIGIADAWGFDDDAQLLAAAGYGVLQVNFR